MKKILTICLSVICSLLFSQTVDEAKKLSDLASEATKSIDNPKKLDSIYNELNVLYDTSSSPTIRKNAKEFILTLEDLKNTEFSARPLKTPFEAISKEIQKEFTNDYDKFKKVGFISTKKSSADRINPYISIKNDIVRLRLRIRYNGYGWLFFEKAIFLIGDKTIEYKTTSTNRDVISGGDVKESSDQAVDALAMEILNLISESDSKIEFRLTGDKYKDFTLTDKEKERIKAIMDLYKQLTE